MHEYLIEAECMDCHGHVRAVEQYDEPVALDAEIPLSFAVCPRCGVRGPEWDVRSEHEIERVKPSNEP